MVSWMFQFLSPNTKLPKAKNYLDYNDLSQTECNKSGGIWTTVLMYSAMIVGWLPV